MTALPSATEPSDAGYFARLDREAAKEEAREEFIRQFASTLAKPWHFLNRIPEDRCYEIFDEALPAIDDDRKKAAVFNQALLSIWVDPHTPLARQKISEMIEAEINPIAEREFEKNPSLFSGSSTGACVAANNAGAPLQPPNRNVRGNAMVAEKTDRQNGRQPFGTCKQALSTVGRELARRGQQVRWNAQRQRAEIVNRCVSTHPTADQRDRGNCHERDDPTD